MNVFLSLVITHVAPTCVFTHMYSWYMHVYMYSVHVYIQRVSKINRVFYALVPNLSVSLACAHVNRTMISSSFPQVILGRTVSRPSTLDEGLAQSILSCQDDSAFKTLIGGTMCTDDFYEGGCLGCMQEYELVYMYCTCRIISNIGAAKK